MSIPESQLETWSHQGSITQSSYTYNAIKAALEATGTPYAGKSVDVFLQGSYGNATNIYAESDVDIVIQLNDCFQSDLTALPDYQKATFNAARVPAVYGHADFSKDVLGVLTAQYGKDAQPGNKAITIAANGSRRKADVIVALKFRRYYEFTSFDNQRYDEGICFYDSSGQQIANYPKQHSENLTRKHQASARRFKPLVRVFKNLRGNLVDRKRIASDVATSYYLEGLLYNVPDEKFCTGFGESVLKCLDWIRQANRSKFVCANEQYYLLHESSPVTWRAPKCDEFLAAAAKLWEQW